MINIADKYNCCGCSACVQACSKQCITFEEDEQGFRYPFVNRQLCVDCGLCEKVCPCLNQNEPLKPLKAYAAFNPNEEIRMKSSSGGIFTMLAEAIIEEGGVVFGARFDDKWEVVHDYTEVKDGLEVFRGSKYVQSRIGDTYKQTLGFLKQGRKVLFSGTSCQIAGLNKYLRKEYDNLISVEILCHSVPSPLIWRKYLKEITNGRKVKTINFRDKRTGWTNYSYSIRIEYSDSSKYSESSTGLYMKGLTSNLTTRPSCSKCSFRKGRSGADIIIGDCWGVWSVLPKMDDNKGTSLVIVLSQKGAKICKLLNCISSDISVNDIVSFNGALREPHQDHEKHDCFFRMCGCSNSIVGLLSDVIMRNKRSFLDRLKTRLHVLKKLFGDRF